MAQVTTGVRRVLNNPRVYSAFSHMVSGRRWKDEFLGRYVRPEPGLRVLDVGCGPGELVKDLPGTDYTGIDVSAPYIASARAEFGHLGQFHVGDAGKLAEDELGTFDVVIALALLHHLDREEILELLATATRVLRPGGRFVSFEAAFTDDMSRISRWLVSKDRGQSVLYPDGYRELCEKYFRNVRIEARHDLLRIPYGIALIECSEPIQPGGDRTH